MAIAGARRRHPAKRRDDYVQMFCGSRKALENKLCPRAAPRETWRNGTWDRVDALPAGGSEHDCPQVVELTLKRVKRGQDLAVRRDAMPPFSLHLWRNSHRAAP